MKKIGSAFFAMTFATLTACGGTSGGTIDGDDASMPDGDGGKIGTDGGSSGSGDGAAPGDTGSTNTDSGANDGSTAGDGSTGADGAIDPFAVGNTWTYDVTEVGAYPLCPSGSHDGKVLSSAPRNGKLAYETQSLCANAGTFYYAPEGDVVYYESGGIWVLVIDAPVVDGHTWSNGSTTYAWHDVGTVTVGAGTFSKCFKAQDTAGPSFTTFCRGVGPVMWSYRDASGANGYDATLSAKSF